MKTSALRAQASRLIEKHKRDCNEMHIVDNDEDEVKQLEALHAGTGALIVHVIRFASE